MKKEKLKSRKNELKVVLINPPTEAESKNIILKISKELSSLYYQSLNNGLEEQ